MATTLARQTAMMEMDEALPEIAEVDADSVESMIEANSVGTRIKQLRLRRSMGLVELGVKTGLSASFCVARRNTSTSISWAQTSTE